MGIEHIRERDQVDGSPEEVAGQPDEIAALRGALDRVAYALGLETVDPARRGSLWELVQDKVAEVTALRERLAAAETKLAQEVENTQEHASNFPDDPRCTCVACQLHRKYLARVAELEAVVRGVYNVLEAAPELNMSNYHVDQVAELNGATIAAWAIVRPIIEAAAAKAVP